MKDKKSDKSLLSQQLCISPFSWIPKYIVNNGAKFDIKSQFYTPTISQIIFQTFNFRLTLWSRIFNFNFYFYFHFDSVETLWGFTKFFFKQMLNISFFYLEKQKSFIPKKKYELSQEWTGFNIKTTSCVYWPNFQQWFCTRARYCSLTLELHFY